MGFPRPLIHSAAAVLAASALVVTSALTAASAQADPSNPTPVSGSALPTAQVNGVVWSQAVVNGVDYVGGSFDQSQPAGAAKGVDVTSRSNLFAYDVATGVALPGFDATANAQVRGVAASADGSRIYIVGDFTAVNGQPRNHVAALTPGGDLLPFAPDVNGTVVGVAVRGDVVYFGGTFGAVNGVGRLRAAAVSASGTLLPFAPRVADSAVRAIAVAPDGSKVLLGGSFTSVNGTMANGLAAVEPSSGGSLPWAVNSLIYNHGQNSSIYSLAARGDAVYATGYVYGQKSDGNLEGAIAMRWTDGSLIWVEDCHGDSYSVVPFNDAVYVATHAHFCGNIGGFEQTDPVTYRRAISFTQAATRTVAHNTLNPELYFDFGGQPGPTLLNWFPEMQPGTYTGAGQAAWSVAAGGSWVVFGGEFTKVNGVRQTGLTRFQGRPESPDPGMSAPPAPAPAPTASALPTPIPTASTPEPPVSGGPAPGAGASEGAAPGRVSKPDAVALGQSKVAVRWKAPKDARSAAVTRYVVKAFKGAKLVKTVSVGSTKRLATVSGLVRATTYRIAVAAQNAQGAGPSSAIDSVKTKSKGKAVSATKKPAKVKKPAASAGKAKVRVRWKSASVTGALAVTRYQVRVLLHGKTVRTVAVDDRMRTKLVGALKRRTGYAVSVRAQNWVGWGAWSTARAVRTK